MQNSSYRVIDASLITGLYWFRAVWCHLNCVTCGIVEILSCAVFWAHRAPEQVFQGLYWRTFCLQRSTWGRRCFSDFHIDHGSTQPGDCRSWGMKTGGGFFRLSQCMSCDRRMVTESSCDFCGELGVFRSHIKDVDCNSLDARKVVVYLQRSTPCWGELAWH